MSSVAVAGRNLRNSGGSLEAYLSIFSVYIPTFSVGF